MPDNNKNAGEHTDMDHDMEFPGSEYENMEGESHSTAKEGDLMTPEQDINQQDKIPGEAKAEKVPDDSTKRTSLDEDESQGKTQASG